MKEDKNTGYGRELPFEFPEGRWGEPIQVEEECPGVYYVFTKDQDTLMTHELYAVTKKAIPGIISHKTASYGTRMGEVIIFEYGQMGGGWSLVKFEVMRYKTKNGLKSEDGETLFCAAAFAAEKYTDYFGGYIPPRMTPWGPVVRVKRAEEGIFFLETTKCEWVLAIAYIIWESELTEAARWYGSLCEYDAMLGEQEAKYLYFRRNKCAATLFELICLGRNPKCEKYIVSREVLEMQVYLQNPEYAISHNRWELEGYGTNNILWHLLTEMGVDLPQENTDRVRKCIKFSPELVEHELLLLPT